MPINNTLADILSPCIRDLAACNDSRNQELENPYNIDIVHSGVMLKTYLESCFRDLWALLL